MASPPTANLRTRSRWDSSKASTIKSAFSRDGHTDYATKNISASRSSLACFRRYDPPKSPTRFPEDPFVFYWKEPVRFAIEDFALGFSLSEGIIDSPNESQSLDIAHMDDSIELRIWLAKANADRLQRRRRHIAAS